MHCIVERLRLAAEELRAHGTRTDTVHEHRNLHVLREGSSGHGGFQVLQLHDLVLKGAPALLATQEEGAMVKRHIGQQEILAQFLLYERPRRKEARRRRLTSHGSSPGPTSEVGQDKGYLGSRIVDLSRAQRDLTDPEDETVRLLSVELGEGEGNPANAVLPRRLTIFAKVAQWASER